MSEENEERVVAQSRKPIFFPTQRGSSLGANIPKENLEPIRDESRGRITPRLADVYTIRGKDGIWILRIEIRKKRGKR